MKRDSNVYIFIYSSVLVVIVAVLLAVAATVLKPAQLENIKMEKRLEILSSIGEGGGLEGVEDRQAYVAELYDRFIERSLVVNTSGEIIPGIEAFDLDLRAELARPAQERRLPVFEAKLSDGSLKYVFPLAGQGLWGGIWGYIALDGDLNTVYGVSFSHSGETPGLGAEIATPAFWGQFKGKQIFRGSELVSLAVLKGGGGASNIYAVDGISGGTITSQGVEDMLRECLTEYKSFIDKQRKERE